MKLAAALAVAVTLALPASTGATGPRVLGIDWTVLGMRLGWYDPATLTRLPGKTVSLVSHDGAWSLSPDGTRVAIGGSFAAGDLRIIDVKRMRTLGVVRLGGKGRAEALAWLRSDRLVAVGSTSITVVDPKRLRVLRRVPVGGVVDSVAPVPGGLVVLFGVKVDGIGPVGVSVIDAEGRGRSVTVAAITAGMQRTGDSFDMRTVGFAVDPVARQAFVVGTDDTIAAVNLQTLEFSYHGSASRYAAKPLPGSERAAYWLGNGLLAVAGNNGFTPSGLKIVDTRTWSTRVVDERSEDVTLSSGMLVGSDWPNFAGYSLDGTQHYAFSLAAGEDLQIAGRYGYLCAGSKLSAALDMTTGTPVSPKHGSTCVTVLER